MIENNKLDKMGYDNRWGAYRIRLNKGEITKKEEEFLKELLMKAEKSFNE